MDDTLLVRRVERIGNLQRQIKQHLSLEGLASDGVPKRLAL